MTIALARRIICFVLLSLIWSGCAGSRDESIGGVAIPIPSGMKKVEGQGIELSLPGFGGESVSFQGSIEPEKVVEFYKKEMPARGWKPGMGVLSRGGMLAYTKEGKTVLLGIGKNNGGTSLSASVGATRP